MEATKVSQMMWSWWQVQQEKRYLGDRKLSEVTGRWVLMSG